jgi:hypothetical protein
MIDLHGYSSAVDVNGWPIDPNHPSNVRERVGTRLNEEKKNLLPLGTWNSTLPK